MGKASDSTKQNIADCFMELVATSPDARKRIDVTTLVKTLGIDRKTFYNHFDNTADLAIWIFRTQVARMLRKREFVRADLGYPAPELHDKYEDMPCYARFPGYLPGTLNQGVFFREQGMVLAGNEQYYRRIFSYPCYLDFQRYVETLTIPLIREDIDIMLGPNRRLPEEIKEFLAEYHAVGIWGRVRLYYLYKNRGFPVKELESFWNYSHEMLRMTLDALFDGNSQRIRPFGL
uniref:TetR/AcrR family transcriptional regulator n=1 Tax=Muribaculaceae bacterium Z82 TaxID=2304548 RepID=A0A7C9NV97_9BACT